VPKAEIEELLTSREVAALLKVEPDTLRKWRQQGRGPRVVSDGQRYVRYRPSDVRAYLEARTEQAPPAA
jgi:excisionase family DNA binding protein